MMVLDLFCGGGGAGMGYRQAGFDVVGVDLVKRKSGYPAGELIQEDVLKILEETAFLRAFDLIHASPPCQTHSRTQHLRDAQGKGTTKVDLIPQTREALEKSGVPFILENVEGAPLRLDLLLCGSMFPFLSVMDDTGKRWLQRHRIFELHGITIDQPHHFHETAGVRPLGIYGSMRDNIPGGGQTARTLEEAQTLMGMPWANWPTLVEAIPPAYTHYIGIRAMPQVAGVRVSHD